MFASGRRHAGGSDASPCPARTATVGRSFSQDGQRFLFLSTQGVQGTQGVYIGTLDSENVTKLLDDDTPGVFAAPDTILVVRQGTLVALRFDPFRGVVSGEPTSLVQPIGFDSLLVRGAMLAVSQSGVLAHRTGIAERRQLMWVDRAGKSQGTVGPPDDHAMASPELIARWTPESPFFGRWTATPMSGCSRPLEVFPAGSHLIRKWTGFQSGLQTSNGFLFATNVKGHYGIFERQVTGAGDDRRLVHSTDLNVPLPMDVSPDGRFLLFAVKALKSGIDLWAEPLTGHGASLPVAQSSFDEIAGQFSPDGKWVAYQSNASGRLEVYVTPFPAAWQPAAGFIRRRQPASLGTQWQGVVLRRSRQSSDVRFHRRRAIRTSPESTFPRAVVFDATGQRYECPTGRRLARAV